MNTWCVWFNNPRENKELYEPMLIEAPTEEEALSILAGKFNDMKGLPWAIIDGKEVVLKDAFSFSVDKDEWDDLCLVMNVHGHKHCVARVRPYFVLRKLDFTKEIMFTANWTWRKECVCEEDDFKTFEYNNKI